MNDAWRVASIRSFEQVSTSPGMELLRIRAESASRGGAIDPRPTLSADDGHTVSRFAALPAPVDVGRTLRCAYSVPAEVIDADTVFSLEFIDGFVIALPHPRLGPARVNRRIARPAAGALHEAPEVTDERRSELQPKLAELSASLASARRAVERLQGDADRGRRAQAQMLALEFTAAETHAELQALRDLVALTPAMPAPAIEDPETERRLADSEERLAASRQELSVSELRGAEAITRAEAASADLSATRVELAELEGRFEQLEDEARNAAERFIGAERERDQAIEARREAEESLAPVRAAQARAEHALAEAREQNHVMSLERDELSRQVTAFDGVAVKARERAAEAETEHRRASGRLSELEVWSAELERRLADATTELADARSSVSHNDVELRELRGELAEARAQVELHQAEISTLRRSGPGAEAGLASAAWGSPVRAVDSASLDSIADAAVELARRQADLDLANVAHSRV